MVFPGNIRPQNDLLIDPVKHHRRWIGDGSPISPWAAKSHAHDWSALRRRVGVPRHGRAPRAGWHGSRGNRRRLLWSAISRAARAHARPDRDFFLLFIPLNLPIILGGPYFEREIANVLEIGYREQPSKVLFHSISVFRHNDEKPRSGMHRACPTRES